MSDRPTSRSRRREFLAQAAAIVTVAVVPAAITAAPAQIDWSRSKQTGDDKPPEPTRTSDLPPPTRTSDLPPLSATSSPTYPSVSASPSQHQLPQASPSASTSRTGVISPTRTIRNETTRETPTRDAVTPKRFEFF
jgi:hypothetical protein